jgi:hypothetical protein
LKAGLMLASNPQKRSRDALQPLPHAFGRDARGGADLREDLAFCPAAVDPCALGVEQLVRLWKMRLQRLAAEPHTPLGALLAAHEDLPPAVEVRA